MTAPPQGVEVDQIEFPAGKVRYYKAGTNGPPIVLLHGGGADNALLSWRNTIGVLAADHRVYAPDLPGQGGSTEWRGRANQRTFEEVLRWLLDAWQLPQATLVGLSMGGSIATGFTLRHPQRVRALALVDSTGMQHRMPHHLMTYLLMRTNLSGRVAAKLLRSNRALARLALNKVFFANPSTVTDLESIVDEVRAEAATRRSVFADWHADAINRRSMSINHLPQLDRITCPVTVIHGEKDALVPVASAHEVAGAIPGAQLRVMPQAGHWPSRERPTEFNALLREFVNALNAPAPAPAPARGLNSAPERDKTAEAPTQRMKVPSTGEFPTPADDSAASKEADEPAHDEESADSPTRLMKVGPSSESTDTAEEGEPEQSDADEPSTEESGTDEPSAEESESGSEESSTDESSTEESSTEESSTEEPPEKDANGAADTSDDAEKDSEDAPAPSTSASADDIAGEKKGTADPPTRFIKVGSAPEDETKDEAKAEPAQEHEEESAEAPDAGEPAKDDSKESGGKPAT